MTDAESPVISPNNVRGAFYNRRSTRHNLAIDALCAANPNVRQVGFWEAVKSLADDLGYGIKLGGFRLTEDAYSRRKSVARKSAVSSLFSPATKRKRTANKSGTWATYTGVTPEAFVRPSGVA